MNNNIQEEDTKTVSNEEADVKTEELEFNKKNREDFEGLMKDSSTNLDGYWDRNNPVVKVILLVLGIIIVVGSLYFIITYIGS